MGDEIVIDRKTLKALGADTRLEILRVLLQRQRTLTELSSILDMSHSTVKEHMQVLEKAELVKRMDEGRKWKYYKLTMKGQKVVAPEEVRALFILALSGLAAGALFIREFLVKGSATFAAAGLDAGEAMARAPVMEAAPTATDQIVSGGAAGSALVPEAANQMANATGTATPAADAAVQSVSIDPWTVILVITLLVCLSAIGFLIYRRLARRGLKGIKHED